MNKPRAERFVAVRKASEDQKKENFGVPVSSKNETELLSVLPNMKKNRFANEPFILVGSSPEYSVIAIITVLRIFKTM